MSSSVPKNRDVCDCSYDELDVAIDNARVMSPIANGLLGTNGGVQGKQSESNQGNKNEIKIESFSLESLWPATLDIYKKRYADGHEPISTGIVSLDGLLGDGYERSQITILIGGPGCGKTAKAASDALITARKKIPVIYWSLELPVDILLARLTSLEERVPWREVARGNKNDICNYALEKQKDLPFYIFDCDSIKSLEEFETSVMRIADKHCTAPFTVVDYLQMAARKITKAKDVRDAVEITSERLRLLAIHAQSSILVISQAGRGSYNLLGSDNKPNLDLVIKSAKESGGVEYDAGALIAIVPANESDPDPRKRKMWFAVGKNRMGNGLGSIPVCFDGLSGWFTEISENDMPHASTEDGRDIENEVLKVITESELPDGELISSFETLRAKVKAGSGVVREALESLKSAKKIKKGGKFYHIHEWKSDTDAHTSAQLEKADSEKSEKSAQNIQINLQLQENREKADSDSDSLRNKSESGNKNISLTTDIPYSLANQSDSPDSEESQGINQRLLHGKQKPDSPDSKESQVLCGYMSDNAVKCSSEAKGGVSC